MGIDLTQVAISAVTTAIVSSFSTSTTIVLMRYFPKVLDGIERSVKNGRSEAGKKETKE